MEVNPPYFFYIGKYISADPYWILPRDGSSKKGESQACSPHPPFQKQGGSVGKAAGGQETLTHNSSTSSRLHGHQPRSVPLALAAIPLSHPVGSVAPMGDLGKRCSSEPVSANTSECAGTNLRGSLLPLSILHRSM